MKVHSISDKTAFKCENRWVLKAHVASKRFSHGSDSRDAPRGALKMHLFHIRVALCDAPAPALLD